MTGGRRLQHCVGGLAQLVEGQLLAGLWCGAATDPPLLPPRGCRRSGSGTSERPGAGSCRRSRSSCRARLPTAAVMTFWPRRLAPAARAMLGSTPC